MDKAKKGAVLFSMGSNLKPDKMNPETINAIFKALASLEQSVIIKWDDLSKIPVKSSNLLYKKWLPQDDILAHPKIKLFITHAGKGGVAEAQYHAVPMVALPAFADQQNNADQITTLGYGEQMDIKTLNEADFKKTLVKVLSEPSYAINVAKFSKMYRDRPLTAKQSVVYWTEYILRHHGAAHMQSPLVHMNFIQANNLDLFACIGLVLYLVYRIFKLIALFVCRKVFGGSCKNTAAKSSGKNKKKTQ